MTSIAAPALLPETHGGLTGVTLRTNPIWGPLPEIRKDVLAAFSGFAKQGDVVSFRILHKRIHVLTHPDHLRHVLVDRAKVYKKYTRGYQEMKKVVGEGLLTAENDHWLRQRRLASPAFHRKRIESFGDAFTTLTAAEASKWRAGETRDVAHDMMATTLRIVEKTLLSRDGSAETEAVGEALTVGLGQIMRRMNTPWAAPMSIPTPQNVRFKRAIATLDGTVDAIIRERRVRGPLGDENATGDLLDMLMESRDPETGAAMTDRQLRDEVLTILLAGHETTAMALSWTLLLLSQNPDVAAALRAEIAGAVGGRLPTMADLEKMPLGDRVIHESMRLYPPAWIVARAATEDDEAPGVSVKKGDWVFMSPYLTHRRADFWPDPLKFDPDRFLPDAVAARHRYAWVPFSAGQRKCIGDQFAMMEARLVLAVLLQRFTFTLVGEPPKPEPLVTLRPAGGLRMHLDTAPQADRPANAAPAPKASGCPFH